MRLHSICHFLKEKFAGVKTYFQKNQTRFFWGF